MADSRLDHRNQEFPERYELDVLLTADILQVGPARASLAAVIEEEDGAKSYWALAHPPGKSDFHHTDCFVARLP